MNIDLDYFIPPRLPSLVTEWWPSFKTDEKHLQPICPAACPCFYSRESYAWRGTLKEMTQELIAELREWINYDPDTGVLTWKRSRGCVKAGDPCQRAHPNGYIRLAFKGRELYAHRVAFALHHGRWPDPHVDHINRIKTDNRMRNLREATQSNNLCNASMRKNNSSGHRGICWRAKHQRWLARVTLNGESRAKETSSLATAIKWVEQQRAELHGEFAAQH